MSFLSNDGFNRTVFPLTGVDSSSELISTGDLNTDKAAIRGLVRAIIQDNPDDLLKAGGCYTDLQRVRPFHTGTYPISVFHCGALSIMTGLKSVPYAEQLEEFLAGLLGTRGVTQQVRLEV